MAHIDNRQQRTILYSIAADRLKSFVPRYISINDNCKIYRRSLADEFFVNNSNYLEKALFRPNSALRMKIISSTYQLGLRQNLHSGLDYERKFQFFKVAFDL